MFNVDWSAMTKQAIWNMKKHSSQILTYLGIGGMLTTTVLAVSETPEALQRIEEKKRRENHRELTAVQTIQAAWKCYIPSILTGTLSTGCLIGACAVNERRNAALAAAYNLSETALREYKSKVIETIGEKKEEAIRESIDKERVEHNPPGQEVLMAEGNGKTLCYDALCGRYFYSDMETLRHAANKLNRQMAMMSEPYISLNEFYMEIGLSVVEVGDAIGWNVDKGLIELYFTSQLANGRVPCLVMTFQTMPDYKYSEF